MRDDFLRAVGSRGEFICADALEVLADQSFVRQFDFVHESAPCQHWSRMSNCRPGLAATYPDLITPSLPLLGAAGVPYVMENIDSPGTRALLPGAVMLCGVMFGRPMYRHRLFKAGGWAFSAPRCQYGIGLAPMRKCGWVHPVPAARAGHWVPGRYVSVSGHERRGVVNNAMGIHWMADREHVKEAIPPAFAEYVGRSFAAVRQEAA
jgi:DNA (cytosine-5)-methyltransferase 1